MNLLRMNLILAGLLLSAVGASALSKSEIADLDGHIIVGNRKSGGKILIFDSGQEDWTTPLWEYNTQSGVDGLTMGFDHFNDQKRVWHNNTEYILIAGNGDGIALFNLETEQFEYSYDVKVNGLSTSVHAAEMLPDGNFIVADPTGNNRGGANLRLIYGDNAAPQILQSIPYSGIHAVVWDYERERLWVWGSKLRKYRYVSDGLNSELIEDDKFSPPWWGSGAHDMMPMVREGQPDKLIFNCQQGIGTFDIENESFELLYGTNSAATHVLSDSKVVRGKGVDYHSTTGEIIYNKAETDREYRPGTIVNSKMDYWEYIGSDTMEYYKGHWFQHNTFSYGPAETSGDQPPSFESKAAKFGRVGEAYAYTAVVDGKEGRALTLSGVTIPDWLTFNTNSGRLGGTPDLADVGDHAVVLRVAGGSNHVEQAFIITVTQQRNPIQHLDASVSGSVIGSPVTQWVDQSGNGNHAIPAEGAASFPSDSVSASARVGVDFGSANNSLELFSNTETAAWLDFTGAASNHSGFAVLVAFKCVELNTNSWNDVLGNISSTSGFGLRFSKSGTVQAYLGGVSHNVLGSVVEPGNTVVFAFNYDAGEGAYSLWDSKNESEISKAVPVSNFALGKPLTIGRTDSSTRYMKGMIGEVKIFDYGLSGAELQVEREQMVTTWISGSISAYETWASTNSIHGGPLDDDDGNGLDNLSEYAVGVRPTLNWAAGRLEYAHQWRNDDPGLIYAVETCTNLMAGTWNPVVMRAGTNVLGGNYGEVVYDMSATAAQSYIRLRIISP